MKNERKISNEEFAVLVQNGRTDDVFEFIYFHYRPYIRAWIKHHYMSLKLEFEDLESIAFQELWFAFKNFDPFHDTKCTFITFFVTYMKNRLGHIAEYNKKHKRSGKPVISSFLEKSISGEAVITIQDSFDDYRSMQEFEDVETKVFIETQIHLRLTEKECQIFDLLVDGYTGSEVARLLEMSRQAINQRMKKIRWKLERVDWRYLLQEA